MGSSQKFSKVGSLLGPFYYGEDHALVACICGGKFLTCFNLRDPRP